MTGALISRFSLPGSRPGHGTMNNRRATALGMSLRDRREALGNDVPVLAAELGMGHAAAREVRG
jgi:hypothetical protein